MIEMVFGTYSTSLLKYLNPLGLATSRPVAGRFVPLPLMHELNVHKIVSHFACHSFLKAQHSPSALYNMVFGPKSLKLLGLRALAFGFLEPSCLQVLLRFAPRKYAQVSAMHTGPVYGTAPEPLPQLKLVARDIIPIPPRPHPTSEVSN